MKTRQFFPWIIIVILIIPMLWLGVQYFLPRVLFTPDDPALSTNETAADPDQEPLKEDPASPEKPTVTDPAAPAPDSVSEPLPFEPLTFESEVVLTNLNIPWEMAYLSTEEDWLITQRSGEVISLRHGEIAVIPATVHTGEGGLLGMAVHPDFTDNPHLYLYLTTSSGTQLINQVVRYRLTGSSLTEPRVIVDNIPGARFHNGGRIAFGPDGYLYITTGDALDPDLAQDEVSLAGKILRVTDEGGIPPDNPIPGSPVYSLGHRNPQGLAWHPETGDLYASEHGPTQMDEINRIHPGGNYGWPRVTCDQIPTEYEDPVACYSEFTLAPSGMTFYPSEEAGVAHLLAAGLRGNQVRHLVLDVQGNVISQTAHWSDWGRIRSVTHFEGDLYLLTNNRDGRGTPVPADDRLIRLSPRP